MMADLSKIKDKIDHLPNDPNYLKGMEGYVVEETDLSKFANISIW